MFQLLTQFVIVQILNVLDSNVNLIQEVSFGSKLFCTLSCHFQCCPHNNFLMNIKNIGYLGYFFPLQHLRVIKDLQPFYCTETTFLNLLLENGVAKSSL